MATNLIFLHKSLLKNKDLYRNSLKNSDVIEADEFTEPNSIINMYDLSSYDNIGFIYHNPGSHIIPFFPLSSHEQDLDSSCCQLPFFHDIMTDGMESVLRELKEGANVDLITCDMNDPYFQEKVVIIEEELNINIRYSINRTGNVVGSDWIMESDGISIRDTYFNDNIDTQEVNLTTEITGTDIALIDGITITSTSVVSDGGPLDGETIRTYKLTKDIIWNSTTDGISASTDYIKLNQGDTFDGGYHKIILSDVDNGTDTPNFYGLFKTYESSNEPDYTDNPITIKNLLVDASGKSIEFPDYASVFMRQSDNGSYQAFLEYENCGYYGVFDGVPSSAFTSPRMFDGVIIKKSFFVGDITKQRTSCFMGWLCTVTCEDCYSKTASPLPLETSHYAQYSSPQASTLKIGYARNCIAESVGTRYGRGGIFGAYGAGGQYNAFVVQNSYVIPVETDNEDRFFNVFGYYHAYTINQCIYAQNVYVPTPSREGSDGNIISANLINNGRTADFKQENTFTDIDNSGQESELNEYIPQYGKYDVSILLNETDLTTGAASAINASSTITSSVPRGDGVNLTNSGDAFEGNSNGYPMLKSFANVLWANYTNWDTITINFGPYIASIEELQNLDETFTSEIINTISAVSISGDNTLVEDTLIPENITNESSIIRSARHSALNIIFTRNSSAGKFVTTPASLKLDMLIEKEQIDVINPSVLSELDIGQFSQNKGFYVNLNLSGDTFTVNNSGESFTVTQLDNSGEEFGVTGDIEGTYSAGQTMTAFDRTFFFGGFGSGNDVAEEEINAGIGGCTCNRLYNPNRLTQPTSKAIETTKNSSIVTHFNNTTRPNFKNYADYLAYLKGTLKQS
jgi:hypothetical protein